MTEKKEVSEDKRANSIVRDLCAPSPSLDWKLFRRNPDGSESVYPFRCRLLRKSETDEALEKAQEYAEKREKKGYSDIYNEAQSVEILYRCLRQVDEFERKDGTSTLLPLFASPQQLRDSLDIEEMAQMLNAYELTRAYFYPSDITDGEVDKYIDFLANGMVQRHFLERLPSEDWSSVIFSLARLARSYREAAGLIPSQLLNTSESDPESSPSGTTISSVLPKLQSNEFQLSDEDQPQTILTTEAARKIVRRADDSE